MDRSQSTRLALGAGARSVSLLGVAGAGAALGFLGDGLSMGHLLMAALAGVGAVVTSAAAWGYHRLDRDAVVLVKPTLLGPELAFLAELAIGPVLGTLATIAAFALCLGAPIYIAVIAFLTFPIHRWVLVLDPARRVLSLSRVDPFSQLRVSFDEVEQVRVGLTLELHLRGAREPIALDKPKGVDAGALRAAFPSLGVS